MRNYRMDNIKAFLIFCVVAGHMLELTGTGRGYRVIYSFHMPAFIFVSGYFAHFDRKRIVGSLIYPYILFQILYLVFDAIVIKHNLEVLSIQFTTPYWILWYLLVMIFYYLLLPFMEGINCVLLLVCGGVLSLISGFDQSMGYYLSVSRFFTFLPYLILGTVWKRLHIEQLLKDNRIRIVNAAGVLVAVWLIGKFQFVSNTMLYGSYSYEGAGYSIFIKGLLLLCALNWICFFMWFFPGVNIPVISSIGKNTLIIFLLHGFIKKYLESIGGVFIYSRYVNMGLVVLISGIIVLSFGNRYAGAVGEQIFTGKGIERIITYCKGKTGDRVS